MDKGGLAGREVERSGENVSRWLGGRMGNDRESGSEKWGEHLRVRAEGQASTLVCEIGEGGWGSLTDMYKRGWVAGR